MTTNDLYKWKAIFVGKSGHFEGLVEWAVRTLHNVTQKRLLSNTTDKRITVSLSGIRVTASLSLLLLYSIGVRVRGQDPFVVIAVVFYRG